MYYVYICIHDTYNIVCICIVVCVSVFNINNIAHGAAGHLLPKKEYCVFCNFLLSFVLLF